MTLSLHMDVDETWRQDWTPFSITVLDLRPNELEGSGQPCGAVTRYALCMHGKTFHCV